MAVENIARSVLLVAALASVPGQANAQSRPTRFWNLTLYAISEFYLAPAGTTDWGPNQCKNDKDGRVDPDERLRMTDVPTGIYDAKLSDVTGRTCIVRNVKVETGAIFSIEEKDLTSCDH
ncbi:MAG: hypothetical protein J2P54_18125 [Bradyrhizobiaceae bacterium]|nr:hypothetical protein [Bradyrhizobiaceae bacterium]